MKTKTLVIIAGLLIGASTFAFSFGAKCMTCKGSGWNGPFKCAVCGGDGVVGN